MTSEITKQIDPARPGIGKGLLWATGSFGCEREAFYGEVIRDDQGWRLNFPMPERVHFGTAIDVLHMTIVRRLIESGEIGDLDSAVEIAYYAGIADEWEEEEPDLDTFRVQIRNAALLLVGDVPNPGEEEGRPIDWLPLEGIHLQGFDGQSIEVPGVFGSRPLVATPDYLWTQDGDITGWCDVKATDRAFSYPTKWLGAEATVYTLASTTHNGGIIPERIGYLEYRRNAKPYWHITWAENVGPLNRLAERYVTRWVKALEANDPDLVAFNPSRCASCRWRLPNRDVGFDGCPVASFLPSEGANE